MSFSKMAYQDLVIYFVGRSLSGTIGVTSIAKEAIVKDAVKTAQLAVQELIDTGIYDGRNPVITKTPDQWKTRKPYIAPVLASLEGTPKQVIEIKPGVLMAPDGTMYRKEENNGQAKESSEEVTKIQGTSPAENLGEKATQA